MFTTLLQILVSALASLAFAAVSLTSRYGRRKVIAGTLALLIVGFMAVQTLTGTSVAPSESQANIPGVVVRSVAELSANSAPLSIAGTVNSVSEATVRAESSGTVTRVYRSLGDAVAAGTVVAELESASERAALLSAEGVYEAAKANLEKVEKGTRSEQLAILEAASVAAQTGTVNALLSAYAAEDNAIRATTDTFFNDAESLLPRLVVSIPDFQLEVTIGNERVGLTPALERQAKRATSLSISDDLVAELQTTESELRLAREFLNHVTAGLNGAISTTDYPASTIAGFVSSATGARTSVTAALSGLGGARQALETANKNLEQGVAGAEVEDVAAARAALKQTEGALAAARANLEKALIRAPISGTINSLSLERGDFVQQFSPVLTVANNSALEVRAYVTEQDAREIQVGNTVSIENGEQGVITRIAPALDPQTKKIEVRIGVSSDGSKLVNGQSVTLLIERAGAGTQSERITIPLTALKVGPDSIVVFTVRAEQTLVAHPVVLGALLGERVVIREGLTPEMEIVVDARGLAEGETVEVAW